MNIFCNLFGHKFIPINTNQFSVPSVDTVVCERCAKIVEITENAKGLVVSSN